MQTDKLHRASWLVVRAGWLLIAGLMLGTFAAGLPIRLRHLQTPIVEGDLASLTGMPAYMEAGYTSRLGQAEAEALRGLGLSGHFYAAYIVSLEIALVVVCAVVGLFIFWRRWDGWLTLWVSLVVVLLGTSTAAPEVPSLATIWPGWWLVFTASGALGMTSNLHFLFLSPDGRFVPRWTMWLAAGFTGAMLAIWLYSPLIVRTWGPVASLLLVFAAAPPWLALLGVGTISQIYRYRHISTAMQRQQTKWVAIGLSGVTAGIVINAVLLGLGIQAAGQARVLMLLTRASLVFPCLMLFPICLGFSIVRYRLWDIDLLIRRTLVYSSLTAALAAIYFTSIIALQSVFAALTGQGQSEFVTVLSTLGIAALVVPLRRRVQDVIDRVFYRRKYDAAQTLATFSASIRDETNLDAVTRRLAQGVEEAIQPAHTSVWLRRK